MHCFFGHGEVICQDGHSPQLCLARACLSLSQNRSPMAAITVLTIFLLKAQRFGPLASMGNLWLVVLRIIYQKHCKVGINPEFIFSFKARWPVVLYQK